MMRGVDDVIARPAAAVRDALLDDLVGLILYGSAVTGGLRPESDVDLLAIIAEPLKDDARRRLISELLKVSGRRAHDGPARPVELTVMLSDVDLWDPVVQLQYGEWLRDDAVAGLLPGPHSDPDATLLLAMARDTGVALLGAAPQAILPAVPVDAVRVAIRRALPALLDDLDGDERNVVLTLARMQATLPEGQFFPKDVAAERAAQTAPPSQARMLRLAAAAYRGEAEDDWTQLTSPLQGYVAWVTELIRATERGAP